LRSAEIRHGVAIAADAASIVQFLSRPMNGSPFQAELM
jgi:hypothetical protein